MLNIHWTFTRFCILENLYIQYSEPGGQIHTIYNVIYVEYACDKYIILLYILV